MPHLKEDPSLRPHEELTTDEARQGVTGHNVRYVLGISLGAVIIAMVIIGIFVLRP